MKPQIKGQIIDILDEKTIVVDKGSADGVKISDSLMIYEEGKMIHDLDGNDIENLHKSICYLQIFGLQEKISLASIVKQIGNYYFCINTTLGDELIIENNDLNHSNQIEVGDLVLINPHI